MNKKAFSLIEVMIILMIISVGVLASIPLMTSRTSTNEAKWEKETYHSNQFLAFGHDGDNADRVGINADPYRKNSEGKLTTDTMGVVLGDGATTTFNKFIFGSFLDTDKFVLDNADIWKNANTDNALIIGHNYPDATTYSLQNSTIISSFSTRPTSNLQGTCIGNVTATNCDGANEYSLNDMVLINDISTTFVNPADTAKTPIVVTKGDASASPSEPLGVKITATNGLDIKGDIYAMKYSYATMTPPPGATGPWVFKATGPNNGYSSAPDAYNYNFYNSSPDNVIPTSYYTYYDASLSGALPIAMAGNYSFPTGGATLDTAASPFGDQYLASVRPSDIRLKNVLKPYEKGLDYICKVKTHYYTFKNDTEEKLHAGIIAQEVAGIFSEALEKTKDGFYSYKKSPFLYAMVNSVKSLYSEQQDILKEQEELLKMVKNNV